MIYLVSISSENIKDYKDYNKIIDDIKNKILSKDKVIIITSPCKNLSEQQLEDLLKRNINESKNIIDNVLILKEVESSSYLSIYLELNNSKNILLLPHQIPIVCDQKIEYIEFNNIMYNLTKCQCLIIPGNYGINRNLNYIYYTTDSPETLMFYIYKEFLKRKYKVSAHIYKQVEQIQSFDELDYPTGKKIEHIKLSEINKYNKILAKYMLEDLIECIKVNKLKLTIGNKFLQGTTISV